MTDETNTGGKPPRPSRVTREITQPALPPDYELQTTVAARLVRLGSPALVLEIPEREVIIGSGVDSDLWVDNPTVSRHHFAVRRDGLAYLIRDLDSTNGTLVDGVRIKEVYLQPGCRVQAGRVEFRFEVDH